MAKIIEEIYDPDDPIFSEGVAIFSPHPAENGRKTPRKKTVFKKPDLFPVPDAVFNLFYPQYDEEYVECIFKSKIKGEKLARLRILNNVLLSEAEGRKVEKKLVSVWTGEPGYDWVKNTYIKTVITKTGQTIWEVEQMMPTGGTVQKITEKEGEVFSNEKIGEVVV
jgi:hypothetical protein